MLLTLTRRNVRRGSWYQVCCTRPHFKSYSLPCERHVRFSNRPFEVKRFSNYPPTTVSMSLTGSWFSSESAPRPFHHGISKTRWNNLWVGLIVSVTTGPSGHANSPHPSSREGHHSTGSVELEFPPIGSDPARFSCCCCGLLPGPAELGAINPYADAGPRPTGAPAPRSPFSSHGAWRSASPRP